MKSNRKISDLDFKQIREDVLSSWPTGEGISIEEGALYHRGIPPEMNFSTKMQVAIKNKKVMLQPRAGVALIEEHIDLLQFLETEGEADFLPTTIDSYTRQNRYEEAALGDEFLAGEDGRLDPVAGRAPDGAPVQEERLVFGLGGLEGLLHIPLEPVDFLAVVGDGELDALVLGAPGGKQKRDR